MGYAPLTLRGFTSSYGLMPKSSATTTGAAHGHVALLALLRHAGLRNAQQLRHGGLRTELNHRLCYWIHAASYFPMMAS